MKSQIDKVLGFLEKHGTITPREALMDLGVYRLSSCIHRLRNEGWEIETDVKRNPDTGAKYASYSLQS